MLLSSLALALPLFLVAQQERPRIECGVGGGEPKIVASTIGEDGILECSGGVVVTYQNVRIESDWVKYDPQTKVVTAGDRVHFQRNTEDLKGGVLSFNIETKSGMISNATGQLEGWYLISSET